MPKRAYSPGDVLSKTYTLLPWGSKWAAAFGYPEINETWLIHGQSAQGKSSFAMQLARELCNYGTVLYMSYEEGVSQSFQKRLKTFRMNEVQGRFRIATDDTIEELGKRLACKKSPRFVIVDSFQKAGWSYEATMELIKRFKRKSFIFISQEHKGQPMGKAAIRLKYEAGVKVRVSGYKAYCQGRFIPEAGVYYTVWEEGILRTTNKLG
jgi:hypothetical protein